MTKLFATLIASLFVASTAFAQAAAPATAGHARIRHCRDPRHAGPGRRQGHGAEGSQARRQGGKEDGCQEGYQEGRQAKKAAVKEEKKS